MNSKIQDLKTLLRTLSRLRAKGRRVVFTNGCFDVLHVGHVIYLEKARSLGDVLIVGLNSDKSVRMIKERPRPINRQKDRARILAALYFVDYVTIFNEETPEKLIKSLRPDILVKGRDWKREDIVGASFVESCGGRVVTVPFVKGYSTTSLIERLKK